MKIQRRVIKLVQNIKQQFKNKTFSFGVLNGILLAVEYAYIALRYKYINPVIPFWFTKHWGDFQLAPKVSIYYIPLISLGILIIGLLLILLNRFYIKNFSGVISFTVTAANIFLAYCVYNIIQSSSVPFEPLVNPIYLDLVIPFIVSLLSVRFLLPKFIDYAHSKKLVTVPSIHSHPGMILQSPSARGGGFVYGIMVIILSLIFVGFSKIFVGLYIAIFMVALLGIIDDFQNTHPSSGFNLLENPFLRLLLLFLSISPIIVAGTKIDFVTDPINIGGVLNLGNFSLILGGNEIFILPYLVTAMWIVWVMNVLSWSNGIDGQYGGMVGIACILIAILALRFTPVEYSHLKMATLAAIAAGAAFGFTKYTWHPSKIMWGFGAMTAGLIIATLSISSQSKIATSILIILIPFLDALVTVVRRLLQGKNPLSGDRGHLHHLLIEKGWEVKKVATFYWLTTGIFGLIALLSPERYLFQIAFIVMGVVAFPIILLNIASLKNSKNSTMK